MRSLFSLRLLARWCLCLLVLFPGKLETKALIFPGMFFPEIVESPTNRVALAGERVEFRVQAEGMAPLNFQWHRNRVPVEGGTGTNLTFVAEKQDNGSFYSV